MTPAPIRYDKGWKADFRHPQNVRHRKLFPFSLYGDSSAAAQAWIDSIVNVVEIPSSDFDMTVREYLNYKQRLQLATPETIRHDSNRLGVFLGFCKTAGIKSPRQFNQEAMRKFQRYYFDNAPFNRVTVKREYANPKSTWGKYQSTLSAFCSWCVKNKRMAENVARDAEFKVKFERRAPTIFNPDEIHVLFEYFDELDKTAPVPYVGTFFRFLAYTGCRPGEAWSAHWTQIDFRAGVVRFQKTKTGKDRSVPLRPELRQALEKLPRSTKLIFENRSGGPYYSEPAWWQCLRRALIATGLYRRGAQRNLYTFRHTFGASLARAGVSPFLMMEIMGHDSINTTLGYALHFFEADRTGAMTKLDY